MKLIQTGSTAAKDDLEFLMVDSTDHVTGKTGLTVTVTIRKAGGSFASPSGTVSEIANGWYKVAANATDNGTVGGLLLHATATGADPTDVEFQVVGIDPTASAISADVASINSVSTSSVTTINANLGTTQPVNFTGTGASALAKSDMVDVAGAAVSTTSAQIGVNAVNLGGTAQTGRDIGASVLLSSGTGTGQLDFTSGVVKSNLSQILGTALTETAGQIAAAFKKFFNVGTPTLTTAGVDQTGDSYARLGAPAGASTAADIAAVKTDTAAIKLKTDNLPDDPADESLIIAATDSLATSIAALPTTTTVNAIKAKTDNLPASPAAVSDIPTANDNADALLDRTDGVETSLTFRQFCRLASAALFGKASGLATTTAVYRDTNDTTDRISATVDSNGNRTAVTLDAS